MGTGTVTFQANDKADVFYVTRINESGIEQSDEALMNIEDSQFDSDKAWVTGNVPKIRPIDIEGDTSIISAWFKSESYDKPFVITVYVELESAEELEEVIADEKEEQGKDKQRSWLEPVEIHL